jgi:hypothetical protein
VDKATLSRALVHNILLQQVTPYVERHKATTAPDATGHCANNAHHPLYHVLYYKFTPTAQLMPLHRKLFTQAKNLSQYLILST